jgi:hypothetical protein
MAQTLDMDARYIAFYNQRRPHSSLEDRTPDAQYFAALPMKRGSMTIRIWLPTASRACVREKRRTRAAVDNPQPQGLHLRTPLELS